LTNLPQTQQRLFERIQQKQKEAVGDKVSDISNTDAVATKDDSNWYSSDDDQVSMLQNLFLRRY
jgi:hypothetical protein